MNFTRTISRNIKYISPALLLAAVCLYLWGKDFNPSYPALLAYIALSLVALRASAVRIHSPRAFAFILICVLASPLFLGSIIMTPREAWYFNTFYMGFILTLEITTLAIASLHRFIHLHKQKSQ